MQALSTYESVKVASNLRFVDGLAWSRAGFLAVADVRQSKIFRFDSDSDARPQVFRDSDGGASGLAYDSQGRLYVCESETRRLVRVDPNGKTETLAQSYQGKKFNAPNDVVVRRDGNIYFTDPAFGSANDIRDLDFYGIWRVPPKGDPEPLAKWQTRPNGIALSADGKILYVSDSDRHAIVAFDLDRAGQGSNQRDWVKGIAGVPGGIKTDVEGRLYVAARGIAIYSPEARLERTLFENERMTNCAFGQNDAGALYVAARTSVSMTRLGVRGALQY